MKIEPSCEQHGSIQGPAPLDESWGIYLPADLVNLLRQLEPETQLGFSLATPKHWTEVVRRKKSYRESTRQFAPLPTRIYATLINNLSAELDDIQLHKDRLLAALREAFKVHQQRSTVQAKHGIALGTTLTEKYQLAGFLERLGLASNRVQSLGSVIAEIFSICKFQIHVFSGMRDSEAGHLPFHCMVLEKGIHGRRHHFIAGMTTKFNGGRPVRTKWVTTELDGFRAIKLAQEFAAVIYELLGVTPSDANSLRDN